MKPKKSFAEKLSEARLEKGLTQSDLIEAVGDGMNQAQLSRYENGRAEPKRGRMELICSVLGIEHCHDSASRSGRPAASLTDISSRLAALEAICLDNQRRILALEKTSRESDTSRDQSSTPRNPKPEHPTAHRIKDRQDPYFGRIEPREPLRQEESST